MQYDTLIATANFRQSFASQREALKLELRSKLAYYYEGGSFIISPELIMFVKHQIDLNYDEIVVLDSNENPILLKSPSKFLTVITETYVSAANSYYQGFENLRKAHNVESVIEAGPTRKRIRKTKPAK